MDLSFANRDKMCGTKAKSSPFDRRLDCFDVAQRFSWLRLFCRAQSERF
jgi:hypothetical protein